MAEIVGAVASGFTLAGVAVGSARTVIRLRQLWSEVKDVPQAVQGLMLKIELFESIILEMEQTVMVTLTDKELALGPDSAIARSTEHCQRQLKGLSDLINDLEAAITAQKRSKRAVAKVKVVLGGSRLTEFERRMRDVVDILVIAMNARILAVSQMSFHNASGFSRTSTHQVQMMSSGHVSHDDDNGSKSEENLDSNSADSFSSRSIHETGAETAQMSPNTTSKEFSIGIKRGIVGGFHFHKRITEAGLQSKSEFSIEANAPSWLYGAAFNFQFTRARGAWATVFKYYNVRPWDSPVFELARVGDVQGVFTLIEEREASVYDVNSAGEGILHMLFGCQIIDLHSISSLVAVGADLELRDYYHHTPADSWLNSRKSQDQGVFDFFNSRGAYDWSVLVTRSHFSWNVAMDRAEGNAWYTGKFPKDTALRHCWFSVSMTIPHLLMGSEMREIWSTLGAPVRQKFSGLLSFWFGTSSPVLSTEDARFTDSFDFLVESLTTIDNIHRLTVRIPFTNSRVASFRLITPMDGLKLTPLGHFLAGAWVCSCSQMKDSLVRTAVGKMDRQLQRWLRAIGEAGYPLDEYGKNERHHVRSGPIRSIRWDKVAWRDVWVPGRGWCGGETIFSARLKTISFTAPKLVDIQYGPEVEDWKLVWDMEVEEMAGEFWGLLDDAQRTIPGSWDPSWDYEPEQGLLDHGLWVVEDDWDDVLLEGHKYVPAEEWH